MNNKTFGKVTGLATVLFIILNFTVDNAGTLFLILAVVAGLAMVYFLTRSGTKTEQ